MNVGAESSAPSAGPRVFYLRGCVTCPLAGVGSRAADESNRLVVDDPATEVTIERGTITLRDVRDCATKTVIADLVWLAEGPEPFTIHIEVFKTGRVWSIDLHTHEPVPLTDRRNARYEPWAIIAVDRRNHEVLVDRDRLARAVEHVPFTRRLSGALTTTRDHLPTSAIGATISKGASGSMGASTVLFDRSIGIGAFGRGMFLIRARLARLDAGGSLHSDAHPSKVSLATSLSDGAWELSLEALTDRWLPELVARDLVLFGLADVPLLAPLRAGKLRRGQTLAFRTTGEVRLDNATAPLPGALEIAREYLEFHMLGGIIAAAFR